MNEWSAMDDEVFRALGDPSRRLLLDRLNQRNGQTLTELCADLDITRQSVSKHLAVLEGANLVTVVWHGREKLHYLNAEPINAIADRWINQYDRRRAHLFADLKTALEQETVSDNDFVYTTYIKTTPERLWQALTDPEFTQQYWGVQHETDWKVGSPMAWKLGDVTMAGPGQKVLEHDPYRRLAFTWHTITPEFAAAVEMSDELLAKTSSEPLSRVSFDLEPDDDQVRLTVIHTGFEPGSEIRAMITDGWTRLLSDLKSFTETAPALNPTPAATP
ncbi:DNA-binding transcriptional ArsR family regulator [Kribbella orskensis]|uniref:DNA-binding transcriptional ArsR family regulator n=1 Tax=Kribbella orskensis TaxID=2512216 RepID=A0ABY2BDX0_9ACTN|nr:MULTISPECIES: SRPBCC domain-containing protein [Kribbella]TCN35840.1 DNA-binding transcriptional ArsR family regulator [Kribbella sp. VKM Ac-2500]TCO17447.1 DNA-binding transcriptional ArsR family regulator [Kribbella orskensis]